MRWTDPIKVYVTGLQAFNVLRSAACMAWNSQVNTAHPYVIYGMLVGQIASSMFLVGVLVDPWISRMMGWAKCEEPRK